MTRLLRLLCRPVLLAAGCSRAAPPAETRSAVAAAPSAHLVERARVSMGSELRLTAWTADDRAALAAFERVFAEFDRLEALMSIWRPGSDVARLNAAAGMHAVPVAPEVLETLRIAKQASEWTDGGFDVTFGPLADLWKFDAQNQDGRKPTPAQVAERLPLVGSGQLVVDAAAGTAFLRRAGMRVHLGGIGKGYAIDRGADILRGAGLRDFLIQAGGDMYAAGNRGDRPWQLAIRDPRGTRDTVFARLGLSDGTFSTSGDYERFFISDGRRYHHIIDLRTGQPAALCRSVTIVADRATTADALSTGVFVMGPEAGMALIERLPHVEGVIVTARNQVLVSSGLTGRLELLAPPTDAP